ncbi:MAG: hypothetical protein ACT4PV_07075 [Planctomycetaceae bacterium]
MKRRLTLALFLLLAVAAETGALAAVFGPWESVPLALFLHVGAAAFTLLAAMRREPRLSQVERDLVRLCALVVPVFGPMLAWRFPHRADEDEEVINAHDLFERYQEHVRPLSPDHERTLFTGDHDKDVARELDAESYYEVLRHGSTDQKRNALARLAKLGEPKHLALIRRCLRDPEHEVRLYAYGELERLSHEHESNLQRLRQEAAAAPESPEAASEVAAAHFAFGSSGILDEAMAAYHFEGAIRMAATARALGEEGPDGLLIAALSHCALGQFPQAQACLLAVPAELQNEAPVRIARAKVAFLRRDFGAARVEAEALGAAGTAMPAWLEALRSSRPAGSVAPQAAPQPARAPRIILEVPPPSAAPEAEPAREPATEPAPAFDPTPPAPLEAIDATQAEEALPAGAGDPGTSTRSDEGLGLDAGTVDETREIDS